MEILEEIKSKIQIFAEKMELPIETLQGEFLAVYEEQFKDKDIPEEIKQNKAWIRIINKYKRELGPVPSKAIWFKGWILGQTPLADMTDIMRKKALRLYQTDADKAIREGFTDSDGTPLDTRKAIFGQRNENFGEPMEEETRFVREVFGIASKAIEDDYKWTRINVWGPIAPEFVGGYKHFQPYKFRAILKDSQESDVYRLNASKLTSFTPLEGLGDLEGYMEKSLIIQPMREIDDWHEINRKDRSQIYITQGQVVDIILNPVDKKGNSMESRYVDISDFDTLDRHRCFVPRELQIGFGKESKVLVIGRTQKKGDLIGINTYGIYPFEKYLELP